MTSPDANPPLPSSSRSTVSWLLATFFGVGYLQPGGGTWASAVTVLLWWLAMQTVNPASQMALTLAALLVITIIGIPACGTVARESGKEDPQIAVIDEVAGQLIPLLFIPLDWRYMLAAFALFRLFDIWKPFPIRRLEKNPGGMGIMLDDLGAGLYALAVLQGFMYLSQR